MNYKPCLAFLLSLLFFSGYSYAQNWSGILAPTRAVDWSGAGVPGGIPARSTQCGATIAAYSGSAATINNAIASCASGQYVSLGTGTFNLSSGIGFNGHSNVTVRGHGANSTLLVFSGAGAGFYNSIVSLEPTSLNENGTEGNVCDWTAGYAAGTTIITLANCGTTTPARGSLTNLAVGNVLILDQLNEAADTGQIWNCSTQGVCANTIQGGAERTDGPCNGAMCLRSQQQGVVVTNINGSQITVTPPLYMPNWRTGQKPQAWYGSSRISFSGIEDVSLDATNAGANQNILIGNCDRCWVKGVRSIYANRSHVRILFSTRAVIRDNYAYQNQSHASVSYGAELMGGWSSLIENNIFQQNTDSEPSCTGPCEGNVIAYNFNIDNVWTQSQGWMQAGFYQHAAGDDFNLWEGNIGPGYNSDDVHGTHHFETVFRNYLIGNQAAGCGSADLNTCTAQTVPVQIYAGSRYMNIIGNVLGQAGWHNSYQCVGSASNCTNGRTSIYTMGFTGNSGAVDSSITGFCLQPACTTHGDYDPQVAAYLMRWGNYDTVNNAVRFVNSEVPSGVSTYGNPVPRSQTIPTSFYLSQKPAWWGSVSWPPIGPDVTGGNIPGVSGHAYRTPAMNCYLNTMGGPAAGTGGVLAFNANTCYGQQNDPNPPTNLTAAPQ